MRFYRKCKKSVDCVTSLPLVLLRGLRWVEDFLDTLPAVLVIRLVGGGRQSPRRDLEKV